MTNGALLLMAPCLLLAGAAGTPQNPSPPEGKLSTMTFRVSTLAKGWTPEATAAARAFTTYNREKQASVYRVTIYADPEGPAEEVYVLGDCMNGTTSPEALADLRVDEVGQQKLNAWIAHVSSSDLQILVPLAGQAPSGPTRTLLHWGEGRARIGGFGRACTFARRLTEYLNERTPRLRARAYVRRTGQFASIYWLADYDSNADWERMQARLHADPEYLALFEVAEGAFVEGSVQERLLDRVH